MPESDDHESQATPAVHELNNSLAAIVAFSHLIRTDPTLPEALRQKADMLVEEATRTRQIVDEPRGRRPRLRAARARSRPVTPAPDAGTSRPNPRPRTRRRAGDPRLPRPHPAVAAATSRCSLRTAPSALEIVRDDPPDAILCDHRMAGMSGIAFHEAVAAIDPGLARRFVFMSGDVLNSELRAFAVAHGRHLLAKPFDIESVDRTIAGTHGSGAAACG